MTHASATPHTASTGPDEKPERAGSRARRALYRWFLLPLSWGALKLLILAIERMTPAQAYLLARCFGWIFWAASRQHRRIVRRNLEIAYGSRFSEHERARITREVFQHFLLTSFDILLIPRVDRDGSWRNILSLTDPQEAFIEELAAQHEPVAFHTAHLGSWEFAAGMAAFFNKRLDFVYRPIEHPQLDAEVRRLRTFFGNRVYAKEGALRGYAQTLREKGWLGVIADQNAGRRAAFLSFFGVPASTETSYFRLYQRFGPRVIAAFAIRKGFDFRFHVEGFFETSAHPDADPLEEEMRLGQWYLDCVEQVARKYPAQYLWTHKRFASRPSKAPSLYDGPLEPALQAQPTPPIPPRLRSKRRVAP